MSARQALVLGLLVIGLAGCSTIDKLTGQTDDTVLPGQREEAVPGKAQFPQGADPAVQRSAPASPAAKPPGEEQAEPAKECPPDDANCTPPADGTFSDPQ